MIRPIPPASLERLKLAFTNFEQMAQVVAEAMGIDPQAHYRLDLKGGAFVVDGDEAGGPTSNGYVSEPASPTL